MICGINGAVRGFDAPPSGISGAVSPASELWIGLNGAVKKVWPNIPVGYQDILDTVGSGTWVCPASGQWEVEGHGAGGHGSARAYMGRGGAGGGGSGEIETITINAGEAVSYSIADANSTSRIGGSTTFGELRFAGGRSSLSSYEPGSASGSIATSGSIPSTSGGAATQNRGGAGGKGNKNKPEQTYGNGGSGASGYSTTTVGFPGYQGGIILTYLG